LSAFFWLVVCAFAESVLQCVFLTKEKRMSLKFNHIGTPGKMGFGVGVPSVVPDGFSPMDGSYDLESDNYGNFVYKDVSVMVYVPRFDVAFAEPGKPIFLRPGQATPNGAKRVQVPAFFNGGRWRPGFFIDKYICSKNGNIASSIKGGKVLSSRIRNDDKDTPFSSLGLDIQDNLGGAFYAAKTRGPRFFASSIQMRHALGLVAMAQRQTATVKTCRWLDSQHKWPAGCVSSLGQDGLPDLKYESDGTYKNCGKTGSANMPGAVSHNGQANGVMDLSGIVWEVQSGIGERDGRYAIPASGEYLEDFESYQWVADTSVDLRFGPVGHVDPMLIESTGFGGLIGQQTGAGYLWPSSNPPKGLCAIGGGAWDYGSSAGVWALTLNYARGLSSTAVGFRAASYL
jgi:hypothetical protein